MSPAVRIAALAASLAACGWIAPDAALAVTLPIEVTLTIHPTLGIYGGGADLSVAGSGTAIVNGSGAGVHLTSLALPASLFATAGLAVPVTDPDVYPVNGAQLTIANGAGTVAATGGGAIGGVLPIPGIYRFCLYGPCSAAVANITVPLAPVGVGGTATVPGPPVNVSVYGAPWTSGTAMVGAFGYFQTITGFAHGPASGTSSTAQPGGTLQLVTPISISTSIGADSLLFGFGILTLRFVPEPATALLFGMGIVALGAIGRRKA